MSVDPNSQLDFDALADLAKRDPLAFERRRTELIEQFLQQVPDHQRDRLRRLQWRIDRTRELAPNPMSACIRLSHMMWDSVVGDGGLLQALEGAQRPCSLPMKKQRAKVLEFKPRT